MQTKITARSAVRAFIRSIEKRGSITTAAGKRNELAGITDTSLVFTTPTTSKPIYLKLTTIRSAVSWIQERRTATRSDLRIFTRDKNSLLLAIAADIFSRIATLIRTGHGFRLTMNGIRYFFAGVDRAVRDLEIAASNGAGYVLMSYYHIRSRNAWKQHVERLGLKILLDSGAFSLWKAAEKGKAVEPIRIEDYAAFIQEHREILHAWFNLDVVGDAAASAANAEYLKSLGLDPIEVWHAGSDLEELARLVALDLPVIAIGGTVGMKEKEREIVFREIFDRFPGARFHFLGGSSALVGAFPWFSADSTGWLAARKYGRIFDAKGQHVAPHIPELERMAASIKYFLGLDPAAGGILA